MRIRHRLLSALLIGTVATLASFGGCRKPTDTGESDESDSSGRITISQSPDLKPKIKFPPEVRSSDETLNRFIEDFTRACIEGEYDRYRLYTSRQVEPVAKDQFEKVYHRVELVDIKEVRALPRISELPYPLWLIFSDVHVRESPEEPIRKAMILAFKEQDQWVIAPAPRALREIVDTRPASQPTGAPASRPGTRPAARP